MTDSSLPRPFVTLTYTQSLDGRLLPEVEGGDALYARLVGKHEAVLSDQVSGDQLQEHLTALAERGVPSALVQGTHDTITACFRLRLIDRLVVRIVPVLAPGNEGTVGDLEIREMSNALTFEESGFRTEGEDIIFEARGLIG